LLSQDARHKEASKAYMSETALVQYAAAANSGQPSFQEAEAAVILLVVMVVTMVMVVMMVVIIVMVVAVVVMSTMRWRISVELLPVVEVALVPRRWLLLRRVVRPLRWSLGRWILTARRRVRLRVPWRRVGLRDLLVAHGAVVASPCLARLTPMSDRF